MSHYKPYPAYKDSGVEWLGQIPEHWGAKRAKFLFQLAKRPAQDDDGIVTAFRDGQVTLRSNRRTDGFTNAVKEIGYQGVRTGDLVIHAMDAFAGAVGVSESDGKCSPVYSCCVPQAGINACYYARLVRTMATTGFIESLAKGIRERSTDFRWSDFSELTLPLPTETEQENIVRYLERETARIDALIEKKTRFIETVSEKITALASQCLEVPESEWVRLQHVVDIVQRPVNQQPDESYTKLGLLNRGRGIFKKDESDQEDMGDSDFYWVECGDLIISGQFAWEGAIALATAAHAGCVVSHRFPVIRGKAGITLTEYLLALLMSKHGDFMLNDCSRGSAGRNRPLNMGLLLKWKIPIPSIAYQQRIAELVWLRERLKKANERSIQLLKERRSALITAAVTGQIDLREAA